MTNQFLIEKRGAYYRPDSAGYTYLKRDAGRYSFEDASLHAGPNGPDGPQDGISIWTEAKAPEFSGSCPWDVKLRENTRKEALRDALNAITAARQGVIYSGVVAYIDGVSKGHDRSEGAVQALIDQMGDA